MKPTIHPSAQISSSARLDDNVTVGAYAIIGDNVSIENGSVIKHHAVIDCNTRIGKDCVIFPFASIGTDPQDITFKGEETWVEIGDGNTIREFATINRGTVKGGGVTRLGNHNYLMAYAHIGHDCRIGDHTVIINGTTLAGHVEVDDHVVISAHSSVSQFVHIGRNAYIGGYTIVLQDILPFAKISQSRENYFFFGPNSIGMMRNGINREFITTVKDIFRIIFRSDLNTSQALERLKQSYPDSEEMRIIHDFIQRTRRGILKNFVHK
ncbi:MAG: acyl-ACP--UDP-N-acetylglucosamine O-acyltransferase [Acidobacteriota bacterium]|jgi:UDP-N-acetylglucosamine acyltransferase|nr:acyl-ACP--UDP-N-acetylglucosamine O-acyltransferase [Acidobacteriota bacterium]